MAQPRIVVYLDANIDEMLIKQAMRELEGKILIKAPHHDFRSASDRVLFAHFKRDAQEYHQGCTIFILTSDSNFDQQSGWTMDEEVSLIKVPALKRNENLHKVVLNDLKQLFFWFLSAKQSVLIHGMIIIGGINQRKKKIKKNRAR